MGSESVQTLKRDISISRLVKQEKWLGIRFHGKRIIGSIYTLYIHWYNILEFYWVLLSQVSATKVGALNH